MIYAKRVRSPLKGGVDVELGPRTLLVGANGTGKTAILQALKLGTRGYVDDQEGRDGVRTTAAIARLFPRGAELVSAVEMSDGGKFSWASKTRGKGYTKPKTSKPAYTVEFPFQTIKALLSGDDKKIRGWLEERSGSVVLADDLLKMLPPSQVADAKAVLKRFDERSPVRLAAALKNEARSLRAAATRKEKTIDALVEGIPLPLSESEVERLDGTRAELWSQGNTPNSMSSEEHALLRQTIEELVETLGLVKKQMEELPEPQAGEEEIFRIAKTASDFARKHLEHLGGDVCYTCMRKDADIHGAYTRWESVLSDLHAAGSRKRLKEQYDNGMAEAQKLAARYTSAEVVEVCSRAEVQEQLEEISSRLSSHNANKRIWKQAEGLRKEVASSRSTADTCTALARTWEKEGKQLLLQRKKDFEDKVTKWLPEGETFVMDLDAGRVGLSHVLDPNDVRTSLSGAELSRVLLAVLSAEGEGGSSTPSILEPEDRGWDPDTLADVMTALTDAPDQVILMSTVPPRGMKFNGKGQLVGDPPSDWSVVHVGD